MVVQCGGSSLSLEYWTSLLTMNYGALVCLIFGAIFILRVEWGLVDEKIRNNKAKPKTTLE